MRGIVLFEGKSNLDGKPITAIATMKTSNRKTGSMVQVWILRSDIDPIEAYQSEEDYSICGNCPQRWAVGGACYVNIGQAPLSIYRAYKRGSYAVFDPAMHSHLFAGRKVRLGAYGDPAAVPFEVLKSITDLASGHTGYTHQSNHPNFDRRYFDLCMVSADTLNQAKKAHSLAARTFRVIATDAPIPTDEIECLSDSKGLSCLDCGLCNGKSESPSVYIRVHGTRKANFLNNKRI
jgi:hypothetical protein